MNSLFFFRGISSITLTLCFLLLGLSQSESAHSQTQPFECIDCNLRGIQIGVEEYLGRNLSGAILLNADLRGSDLSNVVFLGADLRRADLRASTLTNTFFTGGADLQDADFRGATMNGTFFTDANLRNADLRGAVLTSGSLENADLTGAQIDGFVMVAPFLCNTTMPDGIIRNDSCL